MRCESCGAETSPDRSVCEFCGSHLERPAAASAAAAPTPGATAPRPLAAVFEAIRRSPEYARRQDAGRLRTIPQPGAALSSFVIGFLAIFVLTAFVIFAGAVTMGVVAAKEFGAVGVIPLLMSLVPLAFMVLGFLTFRKTRAALRELAEKPLEGRAAVVMGRRAQTTGSRSSLNMRYYATFEFEDGSRKEFHVIDGKVFGEMAEGDAGVVFSRGEFVFAFDRVPLS